MPIRGGSRLLPAQDASRQFPAAEPGPAGFRGGSGRTRGPSCPRLAAPAAARLPPAPRAAPGALGGRGRLAARAGRAAGRGAGVCALPGRPRPSPCPSFPSSSCSASRSPRESRSRFPGAGGAHGGGALRRPRARRPCPPWQPRRPTAEALRRERGRGSPAWGESRARSAFPARRPRLPAARGRPRVGRPQTLRPRLCGNRLLLGPCYALSVSSPPRGQAFLRRH